MEWNFLQLLKKLFKTFSINKDAMFRHIITGNSNSIFWEGEGGVTSLNFGRLIIHGP